MRLEFLVPGVMLLGLGGMRLVVERAGLKPGKAGVLGYLAVLMGLVLVAAGFAG